MSRPFADVPEDFGGEGKSQFKAVDYVKIIPGVTLKLRVLDKYAHQVYKHYIPSQKLSILCLGDEICPICINNRKLIMENPDVYPTQIKGFISRQTRFMVNVLNRTMAKQTSSGKYIFPVKGQFPSNDPDSGELLVNMEATPLNKVQVLERGSTLFSQLNTTNDSITDETGNPIGLWNYNIGVSASGSGRKMVTTVVAYAHENDVVQVPAEELHALETLGVRLSPNEIEKALRGVSLRDLYAERRAQDEVAVGAESAVISNEVQESVSSIFKA